MAERPNGVTTEPRWVLGIDTSSDIASVALLPTGDSDLFGSELTWPAGRKQTATLLSEIDHLFRLCEIESDALSAVVVATGPGGFNALRVGMSIAKGFAFAHAVPIFGVGTLDLAAHSGAQWGLPVRAFVAAGRGRVVFADYRVVGERLIRQGEMTHRMPRDLAADLMVPTVLVGDLTAVEAEALRQQPNAVVPESGMRRRRAALMIDMVLPRLDADEPDDLTTLEPLYIHYQKTDMTGSETRA